MKHKVGDKVKIREDLKAEHLYGNNVWVTQKMHNLRGKIAHITEVNKYGEYCIDLDNSEYLWVDEMFEDVGMEVQKMNKRVVIDTHENCVIARRGNKKGVARCHPDDDFDFFVGAKLALERLEEAEKPYGWLKVGMQYYVPDTYCKNLYYNLTYKADICGKMAIERGLAFKTKEEAIECAKKMLAAVKQEN